VPRSYLFVLTSFYVPPLSDFLVVVLVEHVVTQNKATEQKISTPPLLFVADLEVCRDCALTQLGYLVSHFIRGVRNELTNVVWKLL
jgi:hypothetical protein